MELHVIWFIIPFILLCGIVYSVLRGYIYGAVLAALSLLAALINLVYYIAGFFLHIKIRNTLALCLFLGVMSAVWLMAVLPFAYRHWAKRPSVSLCLIVNVFLILTWNILVYISYFL